MHMEQSNSDLIWNLMARKFSGESSEQELLELDKLLQQNPDENYSMELLQDIWHSKPVFNSQYSENKYKELLIKLRESGGIEEVLETVNVDHLAEDNFVPTSSKRNKLLLLFASIVVLLSIGSFVLINFNTNKTQTAAISRNQISTRNGSKTSLKLADGTLVTLNADSKLEYPENFSGNTREVTLQGEAFFEVAHNAKNPFIIHTKAMDIKVLGTVFNVKAYSGDRTSEASLIKGSIEVIINNRKAGKIILKPNEKISVLNTGNEVVDAANSEKPHYTNNKSTASAGSTASVIIDKLKQDPKENIIEEIAWTQNKLVFKNEKLENIVVMLKRWYGENVILENENLKELKCTGTYYQENLAQVILSLQLANNFKTRRENNNIIIY